MKRKSCLILAAALTAQMVMASMATVNAADNNGIGETYTKPESPAITYNMNLDWKYFNTGTDKEIWSAMSVADKDGKKFYETDYDDSDWEGVSIPHAPAGQTAFKSHITDGSGNYLRNVLLYRKTFKVPESADGSKIFFELEGIRQAAYVWINGQALGYYEAGITAMGFDISNYVKPGETAVIAICNDGTMARNTTGRIPYETVPGEKWGSSYTPDNYKTTVGGGAAWQWNTTDFNEGQIGLVYDALLHVKGDVYQTLPLYNNLKTTGNYIYATDFDIRSNKATINVKAEVRNESKNDGKYTLEVDVVDHEGKLKYSFDSAATEVSAATDAGVVYEHAVEDNAYEPSNIDYREVLPDTELEMINDASKRPSYTDDGVYLTYEEKWSDWMPVTDKTFPTTDSRGYRIKYAYLSGTTYKETTDMSLATYYSVLQSVTKVTHNEIGKTKVNTPDVTYITASYAASDVRFWSLDDPYLYTVYTVLKDESGNVVDVQSTDTGFRKVTYSKNTGISINDKPVWLRGYAQRSTNEWAVIGVAPDWLQDYDMELLKKNNANFIRWMHVAPKPAEVRSSDRYGVAIACPAGDKEGTAPWGRQWAQRAEAMRDTMIYYRNSPSVIFWETGNSPMGHKYKSNEMANLRNTIDPYGMRFIGARSTQSAEELNYEYNYAGTMYGNYSDKAINAMSSNGIYGPIMETEYARGESPRRIWDDFSPPDYDYVNKYLGDGAKKQDYGDVWDATQEDMTVDNVKEYANNYYGRRAGTSANVYSAAAMMVWSDSNMHGRNCATENSRTSGRVDPVRQTKEMFDGTQAAQSDTSAVHILGHWSYPQVSDDTYNYYDKTYNGSVWVYNDTPLKRDPTNKTVYVIGSADIAKVELYYVNGDQEELIGTNDTPDSTFVYAFNNVDVTKGDAALAKAYDARGQKVAEHKLVRTGDAVSIRLTPSTAVKKDDDGNTVSDWRADGSDIAYFDVEVIDEKGNVCPLNYDRITFKTEGEGVFLGGYNSGMGSGCFQNSADSTGVSNFFGGAKDGVSTIGQDYVYAENGTNRVFVRSTRNAGTFTLTASMEGMSPVTMTIESNAIESTDGVTTTMPSIKKPGTGAAPITNNVPRMKTLTSKTTLEWSKFLTDKSQTEVKYVDFSVNGTKVELSPKARIGTMNAIFGPMVQMLEAVQAAGKNDFTIDYDDKTSKPILTVTYDGHTYQYETETNQIIVDGKIDTEIINAPEIEDGVMIGYFGEMLGRIDLAFTYSSDTNIFDITVK